MEPSRGPVWVPLTVAMGGVGLVMADPFLRYAHEFGWPLALILSGASVLVFLAAFGPARSR